MFNNVRNHSGDYAAYSQSTSPEQDHASTSASPNSQSQPVPLNLQSLPRRSGMPAAPRNARPVTAPAAMQPNTSSLFRPPQGVDDAHHLLSSLQEAAHNGHITEQQYRTQVDFVMRAINRGPAAAPTNTGHQPPAAPANITHQPTLDTFLMTRAETDVRYGDSAQTVATRYRLTDPNTLHRLRALEQQVRQSGEDPSPFAFN